MGKKEELNNSEKDESAEELAKKIGEFKKPLKYSKTIETSFPVVNNKGEKLFSFDIIIEIKCSTKITKDDETKAIMSAQGFISMHLSNGINPEPDAEGVIQRFTLAKMDEGNPEVKDVIKYIVKKKK